MNEVKIKDFCNSYVSNTLAGSSNQSWLNTGGEIKTGRVYYKLFCGGKFEYSLLFSNIIDSTYADGSHSVCNTVCKEWQIHNMKAGRVSECSVENAAQPESFTQIYFSGEISKTVGEGEIFSCDPFVFEADEGDYMCIEITFSGEMLPYHEELWVASFVKEKDEWVSSPNLPVPSMVGCKRDVSMKIGFLGDSIVQGIGSDKNSYLHWSARLAKMLGKENSYWNLGIGYARSVDAASDGVWLFKAMQNDFVIFSLGVNDIVQNEPTEKILNSLEKISDCLKAAGVKVVIQSVPPFDYPEQKREKWYTINDFIKNVLSKKVDGYFDCVPYIQKSAEEPHMAKYGGHPDNEGCRIWAEAWFDYLKNII